MVNIIGYKNKVVSEYLHEKVELVYVIVEVTAYTVPEMTINLLTSLSLI